MAKKKEESVPVKVAYETEEIPTFYANVAQMTTSPYDVIMTFGRRRAERDEEGGLVIADAIQVYMSPQHARSVAALLERQLATYAELYGPIPSETARVEEAADEDSSDS